MGLGRGPLKSGLDYDPKEKKQSMVMSLILSLKNSKFILLLQEQLFTVFWDGNQVYLTCATNAALKQLKFEVIQHPSYSPDLAPCDFH